MAPTRMRAALAPLLVAISTIGCLVDPVSTPRPSGASVTEVPPGGEPTTTQALGTAGPTAPPTIEVPSSGAWTRLEVDGAAPGAREDHTWTVDADGRTAYLFGGRDGGTVFDELWAFDLETNAWRRLDVGGDAPAPRFGHEGVWVRGRGLAVWAGQAGSTFFNDLWLFDPATTSWRLLPAGGDVPVARYGSCSGIGPDGRLWISHGFTEDGVRFADTRAYEFQRGVWTDETPASEGPFERCLHACWWTNDGELALYGGQTTGTPALGDLWYFTPESRGGASRGWTEAPAPVPPARNLAGVARSKELTAMFGGRGLDGDALADTWLIPDGDTGFVPLDTGGRAPQARSGAAMVYDTAGDRFVVFGGLGRNAFDDVWELTFP